MGLLGLQCSLPSLENCLDVAAVDAEEEDLQHLENSNSLLALNGQTILSLSLEKSWLYKMVFYVQMKECLEDTLS